MKSIYEDTAMQTQDDKEVEVCFLCDGELNMERPDWCWIKKGPDGCGIPSLKVHDECAVKAVEEAKDLASPSAEILALVSKVEEEGLDLDDLVHEAMSNKAADINNQGKEYQIRFLLQNGMDPSEILFG